MKTPALLCALALACCSGSCREGGESDAAAPESRPAGPLVVTDELSEPELYSDAAPLRTLIRESLEQRGHYRQPTLDEVSRLRRLFEQTLSADARLQELQPAWAAEGWDLEGIADHGQRFWLLREAEGKRFGQGIVAVRKSPSVPVMIQAPHAFFDRDTDQIALELFAEGSFQVCFWNSVHRRVADLADEHESTLNALTTAFTSNDPRGRVIQIHGFSQSSIPDRFERDWSVIVSQGTDRPDARFLKLAQSLRRASDPYEAAVYPLDVAHLGGTQNVQGATMRQLGAAGFVHLELERRFRWQLLADQELRERFGLALSRLEVNP